MVLPAADRPARIPTFSWESVVSTPGTGERVVDRAIDPVADRDVLDRDVLDRVADFSVVPAVVEAPQSSDTSDRAATIAEPLPEIVEATTWVDVTTTLDVTGLGVTDLDPAGARAALGVAPMAQPDVVAAVPAVDDNVPRLPPVVAPTPRPLPTGDDGSAFTLVQTPPAVVTGAARRSRRGLKLLITLVILAALVTAGVFVAKPYLFPGNWDARTEPYAAAVESVRGVDFAAPLTLIDETTADFDARVNSQLLGSWTGEQSMWRALGVSNGAVDDRSMAELLAGWNDAVYSTDDGQVYVDAGAPADPALDAQITMAMGEAALDQEFNWSFDQAERTLDGAAVTAANVRAQADAIVQASTFAAVPAAPQLALLSYAPPVLGYRILAAELFAEFADETDDGANPLARLDEGELGVLESATPPLAADPLLADGDVVINPPRALDRSFWYLVFAGRLDPSTAYAASEAIVENAVVIADRGGTQCVYVTFSGGDGAQTDLRRSALEAWSAAAPAEFASAFAVLADGSQQLVSCDPGVGFDSNIRFGVARELASWRIAELATIAHVAAAGGTDVDAAWTLVSASNIAETLIALPADTSAPAMATAARDAVAAILTPTG